MLCPFGGRVEIDWLRWNWFDGSNIPGIKPTESNRYAAALQQGWPGPLPTVAAPLIKSEFDFLSHRNSRGPPALATATHGPTGIVPSRHAGDESSPRRGCIGIAAYHSNLIPWMMCPRTSTRFLIISARATPSLCGSRYARSDTIRTPLGFPVGDSSWQFTET